MTVKSLPYCLALASLALSSLSADTLVLRDGRRVQGELVAVRGTEVEFDAERGGFRSGRDRLRLDRRDVVRIEFDDGGYGDRGDDRGSFGRPSSGLREREVSVEAAAAWKDTGITVRAGQTVYFAASGRVRWGPDRRDGPEGEDNSPRNPNRPIPNRPAAALIGRVGDSNDVFFIGGDQGPIRMRSGGTLYLGVNDDYLQDNSGSFRVEIRY
ncbi:MAG: LecA/PA-IL family lectin [Vicinamibacterales bacterium]